VHDSGGGERRPYVHPEELAVGEIAAGERGIEASGWPDVGDVMIEPA